MPAEIMTNTQLLNPKQGGDITYKDMVEENQPLGESQIEKLFLGTTVLLTGGTGFLGKLVVEKLLRSCPGLKKIYLIARPKKNKDTAKRLQEQFDDVLYDRLRKENPDFIKKISIIEGDIGQPDLGISPEDRIKIANEVEIIFHGAATVRFDEPLKTAVEINVRGTREMFKLARGCGKLKAFVHVSTAYSNCPQQAIGEKFYDMPLAGDKLIDLVETMDEKIINNITPGLLGEYPNTYAYTKAAGEDIVQTYSKGLPVALFRPSIVIATVKEPVAGWIDNVYGPTGVVVGAAVGLVHVLNCNPKAIADLVPGDMVVNACIAAAWKTAKEYPANHEDAPPPDLSPPVYNYVSSEERPLTWERFMKYNEIYGFQVPTVQAIYYYLFYLTASKFMYNLYCFLLHWIPAYIADGIAIMIGKKPMLRKAYSKIAKFSDVLAYFATRDWKFDNRNVKNLFKELCDADKQIFDFNMETLDWNDYFYNYIRGVRVYLLKDPVETVPAGLKKYNRLRILHYTKNIDVKAGLEEPIPSSVGLKFVAEINNLNEEDCAVDVYPDECCLYSNDDKCDIIEIMGDASDVIAAGATKTFTMVAPLLDVYQRRGYCTLYIDTKPVSQVKTAVRDTVKIKFDTKLKKNTLPKNVKYCKRIDEDPWNDCNPVDCDTYYNGRRSYFNARKNRCIEVPACSPIQNSLSKAVYNPVSNKCNDKSALSKNEIDIVKTLTLNPKRRLTKEVLILSVSPDFDITTLPSNVSYKKVDTERILNTVLENRPTELKVQDMQALIKQQEQADEKTKAKSKASAKAKAKALANAKTKAKAAATATTKAVTKTKAKVEAQTKQKLDMVKSNVNKAKAQALRIEKLVKLLKYLKCNKYTVLVLFCVCLVQCCFICTLVYCMTKNCLCGKKKQVVHKYFNRQNDASITTPLIATSNMDTDTTECQYRSESSNYIENRIKCYKACQKDRTHNMKLSMSDDIISKYTTRRSWNRLPRSEIIPEAKTDEDCKITKKVRSDYQNFAEMKVNFLDDYQDSKYNVRRINVKRDNNNTKNNEKHLSDYSEKQMFCHNNNIANNSKVSMKTVQNYSAPRISGQKKTKTDSIEKSAQAFFSNDSIDEYLSEKGILCIDDIASKCSYTSTSTAAKSTATSNSSRTSKNNIVKNFMSLLPKKAMGPSSDPGVKKTSSDLDLELLYVSRVSLCSSFETDEGKDIKRIKGSSS
ncbi:unnamed protein product [Arctia plantaginis]|uniref:Fatty acyl-CoA reductase n=1 Tax=Arctia plantaginis TaxID=874455 RepID=A0A8S1BD91_ARCPL|nr:unnamed protein product [Arctia plantaginis]